MWIDCFGLFIWLGLCQPTNSFSALDCLNQHSFPAWLYIMLIFLIAERELPMLLSYERYNSVWEERGCCEEELKIWNIISTGQSKRNARHLNQSSTELNLAGKSNYLAGQMYDHFKWEFQLIQCWLDEFHKFSFCLATDSFQLHWCGPKRCGYS